MSDTPKKWYVIRAQGGKENKAKEIIENEIRASNLTDIVSQVLIPTEKVMSVKNGKRVSKERGLYPGYIFIECAMTGELQHVIRNASYVSGFLTERPTGSKDKNDKIPVPLRPDEANRLLGRIDESLTQEEELANPFIIGEKVKIVDGAFNGFLGTVEEIDNDKKKLKVIVTIFGRNSPMDLSFTQVVKE
ncbi:MAG: transcription termination/antitermination factor NusG [Bacteroidales bacterium]|nr:transcription termination/antitermination factor NusG [Bacteroidales bacterium]